MFITNQSGESARKRYSKVQAATLRVLNSGRGLYSVLKNIQVVFLLVYMQSHAGGQNWAATYSYMYRSSEYSCH